jgi:formimidoylglutamate deiminase
LGDGIFPLVDFFNAGGHFGIGSDSNVSVSVVEELRWLEYVQRLLHRERTLVKEIENPSVGAVIFERALAGGAQSLGRKTGRIEIGHRADFIVLDQSLPFMAGKVRDHILDAAVFASNENPVKDVMVGGRWVVKERHHRREEHILARYRQVLEKFR